MTEEARNEFDTFKWSDNWAEKINGEYTFFGVLLDYRDDVLHDWDAKSTVKSYLNDYDSFLLPYIADKPLNEITREDYDQFLYSHLKVEKQKKNHVYSEATLQHFRVIIRKVTKVAAENDICPDYLWGTEYSLPESIKQHDLNAKELVKHKKSLSIVQEIFIADEILNDPLQDGEMFGLAIMFCLGTRNSEACGLLYSDIKSMHCDPAQYVAYVYSTVDSSGKNQLSGKSHNMFRLIPVPQRLLALIHQRRSLLIQKILNGEISVPADITKPLAQAAEDYVDGLHIACRGDNYSTPCVAGDLSRAGSKLLARSKVAEEMMAMIDRTIHTTASENEGIKEKDPTAYLFRRNLGSHLYFLGLSDNEIQYIMGHDIENDLDERFYYRNEEKLYPIAQKMQQRPIVNEIPTEITVDLSQGNCEARNVVDASFYLPTTSSKECYSLLIRQQEHDTDTQIRFKSKASSLRGTYSQYRNNDPFPETVNIMPQYHEQYKKGIAKFLNKTIESVSQSTIVNPLVGTSSTLDSNSDTGETNA